MDLQKIAEKVNILGEFCGKRDINVLNQEALMNRYKLPQADILILFGGSIPYGCDIVGNAIIRKIAKKFMIVGGQGHTTESLRQKIRRACPQIKTTGRMEADIMQDYLRYRYGVTDCLIERDSTNCRNNVTNALAVMKQHDIRPKNLIIVQDSTMQRRMEAVFQKHLNPEVEIINFASYQVNTVVKNRMLSFNPPDLWGMWSIQQYVTLLMGKIPRLADDKNGYGQTAKIILLM